MGKEDLNKFNEMKKKYKKFACFTMLNCMMKVTQKQIDVTLDNKNVEYDVKQFSSLLTFQDKNYFDEKYEINFSKEDLELLSDIHSVKPSKKKETVHEEEIPKENKKNINEKVKNIHENIKEKDDDIEEINLDDEEANNTKKKSNSREEEVKKDDKEEKKEDDEFDENIMYAAFVAGVVCIVASLYKIMG